MNTRPLTYGQLEYLLGELGYRLTYREGGPRVWKNAEFDAVSILPAEPPTERARVHYLMTLRKIAVEKGIVDEPTFERILAEAQSRGESVAA